MTKADLIAAIADRTDMSREAAKNALDAFTDSVIAALKQGEEVRLVGFGTFLPVARAAGMARNPRTGEQVSRPASKTARFRVGEGLKSALNGK